MTATIKIDKDVPIPQKGTAKYPWRDLKPGDSFFVPGMPTTNFSVAAVKKRLGIRLTMRAENGGTRVWRLPDEDQPA